MTRVLDQLTKLTCRTFFFFFLYVRKFCPASELYVHGISISFSEENKLLNKPLTSNGQASTTPVSVETLAGFTKQCNLSTQIDTSLKPKYR